ncbi:acetyltransferase [Shouchella clausii]|uniref:acetyltransferase n=1 Tax=Shouchella clausii TaxID=79880 RepID=UPI000BA6D5C9|nr:acetyltransferase [Shouchella clausii]PAE96545.1 acetyltransferase [Shouchella clausii]
MKKKLLVIGASGQGKVVADVAIKMSKWEAIYFLDDNKSITAVLGFQVIGSTSEVTHYIPDHDIFIAIGNNKIRKNLHEKLEEKEASIPTLVHPSAVIGEEVELGAGTIVMAGAIINCCTKIGKSCIVNTGATVDHDNRIGNFVHISPGAHLAGTVRIGEGCWLGIGSVINNNINIIGNCVIGAGAVVIDDIKKTGVYVGVPARGI